MPGDQVMHALNTRGRLGLYLGIVDELGNAVGNVVEHGFGQPRVNPHPEGAAHNNVGVIKSPTTRASTFL